MTLIGSLLEPFKCGLGGFVDAIAGIQPSGEFVLPGRVMAVRRPPEGFGRDFGQTRHAMTQGKTAPDPVIGLCLIDRLFLGFHQNKIVQPQKGLFRYGFAHFLGPRLAARDNSR